MRRGTARGTCVFVQTSLKLCAAAVSYTLLGMVPALRQGHISSFCRFPSFAIRKSSLINQEGGQTTRVLFPNTVLVQIRKRKSLLPVATESTSWTEETRINENFRKKSSSLIRKRTKHKNHTRIITNVDELRTAILDEGLELRELENAAVEKEISTEDLIDHKVVKLIAKRFRDASTPGSRPMNDTAKLALSIEGGGMRGSISAGMAGAIASLGLCDTFDAIYGSSSGSVVGSYMASRQMSLDVYTHILPEARTKFVCKKRIMKSIAVDAVNMLIKRFIPRKIPLKFVDREASKSPGMNISYVLDSIMDLQHGLRPLDMDALKLNDAKQPLRIATSAVSDDGRLEMLCLGSEHFFNQTTSFTREKDIANTTAAAATAAKRIDGNREGLFACLEASMTVPGATGPPIDLHHNLTTKTCFDAFCFEPLPYRSAVDEGATHVLVLRSNPEGFFAGTKPTLYEKAITPLYFHTHGQPTVAEFFHRGGQQYIYLEDLLTLEEGRNAGITNEKQGGVPIPPAKILYGVGDNDDDNNQAAKAIASNRKNWKRAHILPMIVPKGTKELSTLEQDQREVVMAVRSGFAAAYDLLAPAIGVDQGINMTGARVAELVFPYTNETNQVVHEEQHKVHDNATHTKGKNKRKRDAIRRVTRRRQKSKLLSKQGKDDIEINVTSSRSGLVSINSTLSYIHDQRDAVALLSLLPGIQSGQIPNLSEGLHFVRKVGHR